ncbi:MAG TPA: GNAT family N-acetyltransferase [Oscillospiraceae bacterium]|nr:GNAT family N-acetyltransferase [Oscillospiraceae bacterium]HPS34872.1 GNAT family N-acetyltransferase [Oscillospiraceae bacterium]
MIRLISVNEDNWIEISKLSVTDEQKEFLDSPIGIIARGYVYRNQNARVLGIADNDQIIGITLVKDLDEEPACYDLQQFMIDQRFQNKGYGTEALKQFLIMLGKEGKYKCVEVCVNKADTPALRMYEKVGFQDTGYIDDNCPDCRNLMYYFKVTE